jgi:cytochrome c-type biogenesis protein CcmH/NrfG
VAAKVSLEKYVDQRCDALGTQHDHDISAVKEQAEQSRLALEHRLDGMNEFREQLRDQAARLVTRELMDGVVDGLRAQDEQQEARLQQLERRVVADEGAGSAEGKRSADRQSRATLIVAIVTTVLFLISAVASVVLATRPGH